MWYSWIYVFFCDQWFTTWNWFNFFLINQWNGSSSLIRRVPSQFLDCIDIRGVQFEVDKLKFVLILHEMNYNYKLAMNWEFVTLEKTSLYVRLSAYQELLSHDRLEISSWFSNQILSPCMQMSVGLSFDFQINRISTFILKKDMAY